MGSSSRLRAVILGGGAAGASAALALRAAGHDGTVTVVSAESRPPYQRPPLSKAFLSGKLPEAALALRPQAVWGKLKIELVLDTEAIDVDIKSHSIALSDGRSLEYDTLMFATGGAARTLPSAAADPRIRTLRTLADACVIKEKLQPGVRVAVVGGGFIGAEIAATARQLGCVVSILEACATPFQRVLPEQLGNLIAQRHRAHGAEFLLDASVSEFDVSSDAVIVRCVDGRESAAELVIIGIGMRPNDDLAQRAGLTVADGIVVDEHGRASDEAVYAAGDVARFFHPRYERHLRLEHWQSAQRQAAVAARNMAGQTAVYDEVPWAWSDQYGDSLHFAGLTSDGEVHLRGDSRSDSFTAVIAEGEVAHGVVALNAADDVRHLRTLLASGNPPPVAVLCDIDVDLEALARTCQTAL